MAFWHDWRERYRQYNRNVRLFLLANLYIQIAQGIFMVMYNFYIRELGFTDHVNGKVIAMTALASAIILIPAGILSDRFGRKKVMLLGVSIVTISAIIRGVITRKYF